jgi:hypothetical protein
MTRFTQVPNESPAVTLTLSSSVLSNILTSFTLNLSDRLDVPF